MINLTANVMNNSESQYLNQTSFCAVTSNNASSLPEEALLEVTSQKLV